MRLTKTLAAVAIAATALSTTAIAGGLDTVTITPPPTVIVDPPVQRSSWGIILPIAAVALLIALAGSQD